jgi:iron complex transport system substrate-binding protein
LRVPTRPFVALGLCLAVTSAATSACGDQPDSPEVAAATTASPAGSSAASPQPAEGQFPIVVETASGEVTIDAQPKQIVSMSPTATEMLFAIGAGDQVKAVDSYSNYPAEAPLTDLSAFEPNLEAIATYQPDLVVLGFGDDVVQAGLDDLGVPVLLLPAATTLDDTYDQVAQLGEATGHIDEAAAVNAEIRRGIEQVVSGLPAGKTPVRVYHELDSTFFSASSGSYIGQLYQLLGYDNIADVADPDGSIQYPQLQAEQIIEADPTLIVFTDAYGDGPEVIAARPGWDTLTAVANGSVVQVDDDIASRWGPRVVEFLRTIAAAAAAPVGQ